MRKFILDRSKDDPFGPDLLYTLCVRRVRATNGEDAGTVDAAALGYLSRSPAAVLSSRSCGSRAVCRPACSTTTGIAAYLSRLLSQPGRTDDFRKLARKLFIVATDLDSGRSAPFGSPGLDEVPISEAVKASAALPGLYPPARIGDRDYVDGALKKTFHASVALKAGAKLLICINPIVPYNGGLAAQGGAPRIRLAERGLLTVLSQTFRALVHSRMTVGMERYAKEFPDADVVLFEPAQDDEVIFFANIFSYADRRRLADHAYRHTLAELQAAHRRTGADPSSPRHRARPRGSRQPRQRPAIDA